MLRCCGKMLQFSRLMPAVGVGGIRLRTATALANRYCRCDRMPSYHAPPVSTPTPNMRLFLYQVRHAILPALFCFSPIHPSFARNTEGSSTRRSTCRHRMHRTPPQGTGTTLR
jgi:hypothetical protein